MNHENILDFQIKTNFPKLNLFVLCCVQFLQNGLANLYCLLLKSPNFIAHFPKQHQRDSLFGNPSQNKIKSFYPSKNEIFYCPFSKATSKKRDSLFATDNTSPNKTFALKLKTQISIDSILFCSHRVEIVLKSIIECLTTRFQK